MDLADVTDGRNRSTICLMSLMEDIEVRICLMSLVDDNEAWIFVMSQMEDTEALI